MSRTVISVDHTERHFDTHKKEYFLTYVTLDDGTTEATYWRDATMPEIKVGDKVMLFFDHEKIKVRLA